MVSIVVRILDVVMVLVIAVKAIATIDSEECCTAAQAKLEPLQDICRLRGARQYREHRAQKVGYGKWSCCRHQVDEATPLATLMGQPAGVEKLKHLFGSPLTACFVRMALVILGLNAKACIHCAVLIAMATLVPKGCH